MGFLQQAPPPRSAVADARLDPSDALANWRLTRNQLTRELWQRFVTVAKPYWFSAERRQARVLLGVLLLLMLAVNALNIVITYAQGDLTTALNVRDVPTFYRMLWINFAVYALGTPIVTYYTYLQSKLGLYWRRWMTHDFLGRWFGRHAYYRINQDSHGVDNPDERISQDINSFANDALSWLLAVLGAVITFFSFIFVLWRISPILTVGVVVYAAGGTIASVWLGRPLFGLNFAQLRKEADFRYGLVHIRRNTEQIAFYHGEEQEEHRLNDRFHDVVWNYYLLIGWQRNLGFFQNGYNYLVVLIPSLLLAPLYFAHQVQLGALTEAGIAFSQILGALALIVGSFDGLSSFVARINRLADFQEALEVDTTHAGPAVSAASGLAATSGVSGVSSEPQRPVISADSDSTIALDHVTVMTPHYERVLVRDLSLTVAPGKRLLIRGPNGAGKSSLVRAVAGLWNAGSGHVVRPERSKVMFLPQVPYMPLGSLRRCLTYPLDADAVSDEEIAASLAQVGLENLPDRVGGLDSELNWADVLSLGEQQRIAFARLFLNRPDFAVLDEATSSLDVPAEEWLYGQLADSKAAVVSVGHRPTLLKYHHNVLDLPGDGTWKLLPAPEVRR